MWYTKAEKASTSVFDVEVENGLHQLLSSSHRTIDITNPEAALDILHWGLSNIFTEVEMDATTVKNYDGVNLVRLLCADRKMMAIYSHLVLNLLHFKNEVSSKCQLTDGLVITVLLSSLIGLTSWALPNHGRLQDYNIDPTSLTSLFIVVEGLILAAFVALYAENWSWHDMIRGQLFVLDYEDFGSHSQTIDRASLIRHVIEYAKQYEHIVAPEYLCYVEHEYKEKMIMPHGLTVTELKHVGYSVMHTTRGYYVRETESYRHREALRYHSGTRSLHVVGRATENGPVQ
ncbi:hypothetical protein NQZ79_g1272 [Umbelopsis isabellina]|nr:hypothetical protein NQZ79_g1272 [Umbelopsis isabellina]